MNFKIPKTRHGKDVMKAYEDFMAKSETQSEANVQAPKNSQANKASIDGFIYVPSINLHFSRERKHLNKNWFEGHELLQSEGYRMPTIPEFIELLKYTKSNDMDLFNEITEVRNPIRANWLDADFKVINKKLHINYNHIFKSGTLNPNNSEPLEDCLMEDKTPGIDLDEWLINPTRQGLPKADCPDGDLYYWSPPSDNNSVARFGVYPVRALLYCSRNPSDSYSYLGVFAVRENQGGN